LGIIEVNIAHLKRIALNLNFQWNYKHKYGYILFQKSHYVMRVTNFRGHPVFFSLTDT